MTKIKKITLVIVGTMALYYSAQYATTAINYNCQIIKDDCVPPIYRPSQFVYRILFQPPWLDQFKINPTTYLFEDGEFGFWEGTANGKNIVIRVPKEKSPVQAWIAEGLPLAVEIRPASGAHAQQWLKDHPEQTLLQ
ncbi:MAG: hypothetical protein RIQ54_384 [Candidatus Parcubacteria bacterium]|jgi:hypothetical protein